jgi:hypothetical protein
MFTDGWRTLLGYVGCAVGITFSTGGYGMWMAAVACAALVINSLDG